jgi:metal-responsive CopG/Arc/MetJ family transcriptional regulator
MMFVAMENSVFNVADVSVSRMRSMKEIFQYNGQSSKGTISNVKVRNNKAVEGRWTAVAANNSSDVTVSNFLFVDNTDVINVFSSTNGAKIRVIESRVQGVTGTLVSKVLMLRSESFEQYSNICFAMDVNNIRATTWVP